MYNIQLRTMMLLYFHFKCLPLVQKLTFLNLLVWVFFGRGRDFIRWNEVVKSLIWLSWFCSTASITIYVAKFELKSNLYQSTEDSIISMQFILFLLGILNRNQAVVKQSNAILCYKQTLNIKLFKVTGYEIKNRFWRYFGTLPICCWLLTLFYNILILSLLKSKGFKLKEPKNMENS